MIDCERNEKIMSNICETKFFNIISFYLVWDTFDDNKSYHVTVLDSIYKCINWYILNRIKNIEDSRNKFTIIQLFRYGTSKYI